MYRWIRTEQALMRRRLPRSAFIGFKVWGDSDEEIDERDGRVTLSSVTELSVVGLRNSTAHLLRLTALGNNVFLGEDAGRSNFVVQWQEDEPLDETVVASALTLAYNNAKMDGNWRAQFEMGEVADVSGG